MPYKSEAELAERASTLVNQLSTAGIDVDPTPALTRDYLLKLKVLSGEFICIHHSPKRGAFSLTLERIHDTELGQRIEAIWHKIEGSSSDTDVTKEYVQDYVAYVDGSYFGDVVAYGAVILHKGQRIESLSGVVAEDVAMRQVAGELTAVLRVVNWCHNHGVRSVQIVYDYDGIEKWAIGAWRANKPATQAYQQRILESGVAITWTKVRSHSGDYWNDVVDSLAKEAASATAANDGLEASDEDDRVGELQRIAEAFTEYLVSSQIDARYVQIYNNQFARIVLQEGHLDIYSTRKKPITPRFEGIPDTILRALVEKSWHEFDLGADTSVSMNELNPLAETEYYLDRLRPYRHLSFDFTAVADALKRVMQSDEDLHTLPTTDFDYLEKMYLQLKGAK